MDSDIEEFDKRVDKIVKEYKRNNLIRNIKIVAFYTLLILFITVLISIYILLANHFRDNEIVYRSLVVYAMYFSTAVFYYIYSRFLSWNWMLKHTFLSDWLESTDEDDPILRDIGYCKCKVNTMENLVLLKVKILEYSKNDLEKVHLLKAYYSNLVINNKKFIWQVVTGFFLLVMGFIISETLRSDFNPVVFGAELRIYDLILITVINIGIIYRGVYKKLNRQTLILNTLTEILNYQTDKK